MFSCLRINSGNVRHEFVMEGHRWFDLTRMCTPQEFVSIIKAAKPESTPKEYHVKFPIPQREIDLSQNMIRKREKRDTE